jgi:hypothetical protein
VPICRLALVCFCALAACLLYPRCSFALSPPIGTQAGRPEQSAAREASKKHGGPSCNVAVPVIGGVVSKLTNGACEAAEGTAGVVGGLVGEAAGAVGNGILDVTAKWMIGAATSVATFVSREMQQTTTPQLQSSWYEAQFQPMADLGAALGLLVALLALASAAIRRSPEALAATLAGIGRAGIGTGLVVALTVIGLGVADQISSAVLSASPDTFWTTASHAWGTSGFGGFGSSALAMLIALIEVFAAIFVWLELIVRNAAIYVAVLFFPAALAAAIWPALSAWPGRLGRLLALFVILKPVALIVLSLAGNAAAAGLSLGGGASSSVGTILAATVIFALAAFAPWALMYLLAADAESAYVAAGLRAAAAGAVGDRQNPSVRSAGGLRDSGAEGSGGGQSGGGGSSGGGGPGGRGPIGGGPTSSGGNVRTSGGSQDDSLPVGAETIGGGSVGAAAGVSARSGIEGPSTSQTPDAQGGGATPATKPAERSGNERTRSPSTAGGASPGASPQRPSGGSAGAAPTERQPRTDRGRWAPTSGRQPARGPSQGTPSLVAVAPPPRSGDESVDEPED